MILCGILLILSVSLWIKFHSYKQEYFISLPERGNELKKVYPVAWGIIEMLASYQIRLNDVRRKKSIERLNVIQEYKDSEVLYNIRRVSLVYVIITITAAFGLFYGVSLMGDGLLSKGQILRPSYGDPETTYNFYANDYEMSLEVAPVEYEIDQVLENFEKGYDELMVQILGDNESLEAVNQDLNLISYIPQYAITVRWLTSNIECVDLSGQVHNETFLAEDMVPVVLTAIFSYQACEAQYEINVNIVAPDMNQEELFYRKVKRELENSEKASRQSSTVDLPSNIGDVTMKYHLQKENHTLLLVGLGLLAAGAIFPGMNQDLNTKVKERKNQMLLDYSEIVSKLNILSGSGMSILRAWEKIVKDYEKKCTDGRGQRRYAYEEMKITYYEIESGISETAAYAEFGRRCNVHEYLKLGSLLEQNVKKGAKGLSRILEEEANLAFEQRKNIAKKLGEEAGTKLLIPMMIMLAIVMVIVMIPAFTSFQV